MELWNNERMDESILNRRNRIMEEWLKGWVGLSNNRKDG